MFYRNNFRDTNCYENKWKSFHKLTSHGLVVCYQTCKISFVEEFPVKSPIEIQPVLFRAGDTHILIFFIYRPPGRVKKSIFDLVEALHSLPVLMEQWYWLISSNVGLAAPLMQEFGYIQ